MEVSEVCSGEQTFAQLRTGFTVLLLSVYDHHGVSEAFMRQFYFPSVFVLSCCGFNTIRYLSSDFSRGCHTAPALGGCLNFSDTTPDFERRDDDDDELMLNVLRCHLTY